jgi:hypothetical protein
MEGPAACMAQPGLSIWRCRALALATAFCLVIMAVWEWLRNFDLVAPGNGGFGLTIEEIFLRD